LVYPFPPFRAVTGISPASCCAYRAHNSRHEGEDLEILKRRDAVYQEAQKQLPLLVSLDKLEIGKK
jgi:hypothetical protein